VTPTLRRMRADRAKQLLKNGVYRAIGETMSGVGALDGDADRTLRVLMYHKVNDLWPNPTTVPTAVFEEQMGLLEELRYTPVSLDAVRDHYMDGGELPPRAVLITFDDGYRDNLENAFPVLRRHGYPAVVFVPIGFLDDGRPLPHEEPLRLLGIRNETLGWDDLAELEAGGVRIESHGIGHRPVSELEPAEAAREIALSKLRLEECLGREVEAFAFVKGSLADYRPEHASLVQQAGYKLAFTSVSGANGPVSDRFRLRRYNVEPYPARTFELVLSGACDLIAVKDTVLGTHARRAFNAALGTATR
jgi:peptidoglycan/xylan/chitin deacetylase (PgdA/CDA1 family)